MCWGEHSGIENAECYSLSEIDADTAYFEWHETWRYGGEERHSDSLDIQWALGHQDEIAALRGRRADEARVRHEVYLAEQEARRQAAEAERAREEAQRLERARQREEAEAARQAKRRAVLEARHGEMGELDLEATQERARIAAQKAQAAAERAELLELRARE